MRHCRCANARWSTLLSAVAGAFLVVALSRCASSPRVEPDPTPEHPRIGCIADRPFVLQRMNVATGGRTLPEIIHVIGLTSFEDGKRPMVVRGVYSASRCIGPLIDDRASCAWEPWPIEKIKYAASECGPEFKAHLEVSAER